MDGKVKVTLTGPAKIDGVLHKAYSTPVVDSETLKQLHEAGVVLATFDDPVENTAAPAPSEMMFTKDEFERAVAETAKVLAETMLDEVVEQAMADVTAEKAAAVARADAAEKAHGEYILQAQADVDRLQARNAELEATIAALTPPPAATTKKPKGG